MFHDTPKHSSRLNQIEIWFSILVGELLKRVPKNQTAKCDRVAPE